MRVGILGLGSVGKRHRANLTVLGCTVVSWDIAKENDYDSPEDFIARADLDAVVIATPYDCHLGAVELAVKSRLPFLVEKPLGSLEQLPRWRELAAMDLPVHSVGYNWRFHAQLLEWRNAISRADPDAIVLKCQTDMELWPGNSYGDPLLECSHEIDTALWLGAETSVTSAKYIMEEPGMRIGLGKYQIELLWARSDAKRQYLIRRYCSDIKTKKHCSCPTHEFLPITLRASAIVDESYRREMRHFLDCVRDGRTTTCTINDGLKVLEVCAQVEAVAKA